MKVDLSNLKVGDTVHFRCGANIVVKDKPIFAPNNFQTPNPTVSFDACVWSINGRYNPYQPHPFDIVAVTPKPEPRRIKGWVNVYSNTTDDSYLVVFRDSREEADENKKFFDKDRRIACIYIDVAEGEGL